MYGHPGVSAVYLVVTVLKQGLTMVDTIVMVTPKEIAMKQIVQFQLIASGLPGLPVV